MTHASPPPPSYICYDEERKGVLRSVCAKIDPNVSALPGRIDDTGVQFCGLHDAVINRDWSMRIFGEGQKLLGILVCQNGNISLVRARGNP